MSTDSIGAGVSLSDELHQLSLSVSMYIDGSCICFDWCLICYLFILFILFIYCVRKNMTGATCRAGKAHYSGHLFPPSLPFGEGSCFFSLHAPLQHDFLLSLSYIVFSSRCEFVGF